MQTRKCMQKHIDNLYQILNLVEQMKTIKDDGAEVLKKKMTKHIK